jgi:CelD/BcsL family acetyltransferase involved in cellulose biosynthesis
MHFSASNGGTAAVPCTVEIIRDLAGLDALRAEWDTLYANSPTASPPLRWEWVRTWWQIFGPHYGEHGRGLRILTVRRGSQLLGILPLYLGRIGNSLVAPRRLGFISTGAAEFEETCTEYLNLLHVPAEEGPCLQTLAPVLSRPGKLGWDELHLSELPAGSPLLSLAPSFTSRFLRVRDAPSGVCHLFSMAGGFESYLQRLSHENRRQARKMLREVDAEGMEFEVAPDAHRLNLFFDQMIELHRQRWTAVGKTGSFAPRHAEFHRKTAELLLGQGEAVIARLTHAGGPLAVVFGYRIRDSLHCYQQGVATGVGRLRSPGTAAWLLLMRHQAERGVTVFDHLQGMTQFKERFATDQASLAELHVLRVGLRTVTASAVDLMCRGGRRLFRLVRRSAIRANHPVPSESSGENGSPPIGQPSVTTAG